MKRKRNIVLTILILVAAGFIYFTWQRYKRYHPPYSPEINAVLFMAGDNRSELEKVLKHYSKNPADSMKLRAAEFLIINMPGKYSKYYDAPWNDVATVLLRWTSSSDKQRVLNTYSLGEPTVHDDVKYITAEYLINNIDLAFEVWQKRPWGKHISFDVFCETILPYRIDSEPLENWREKALASFADLEDFLNKPATSAVEACRRINDLLPRFRMDKDFPPMNFTQLMASARGTCDNLAAMAVFSMRALGIPVTFELTPKWVDLSTGHSWNAVLDSAGNSISFMGADTNPYDPHQGNTYLKSKVYRRTFAIQQNITTEDKNIPPLLHNCNSIKDVSAEYSECTDTVSVHLKYHPETQTEYVYLATEYKYKMYPVAWAKINAPTVEFSSLGRGVLYFPVYYANNVHTPASDPFWLDAAGNTLVLSPDSPDTLATFTRIIQEDQHSQLVVSRMLHGVFEGANKPDFSDAKTLYTVNDIPQIRYNEAILKTSASYRYVRYKSPENGFCNVAEIEFYNPEGEKLNGTHIGTSGAWENSKTTGEKAFDNSIRTYYDARENNGAWTGLDFNERKQIRKIRYFPRMDNIYIYEGHEYELFYYTKNGWTSFGKQTATGNTLQYNIPSQALMYLYNVTIKKTGKIFFFESGKIHWR
jgi:hypothetical protein